MMTGDVTCQEARQNGALTHAADLRSVSSAVDLPGRLAEPTGTIDYLQEENGVLRDQRSGKRLRFSDDQRRRLAVRAKRLGWRMLYELTTIATPATLLA